MELIGQAVSLAVLLAIELGMPVAILAVVGYLSYRSTRGGGSRDRRPSLHAGGHRGDGALDTNGVATPPSGDCQLLTQVHPAASGQVAGDGKEVPCWRTASGESGRINEGCMGCDRFLSPSDRGRGN